MEEVWRNDAMATLNVKNLPDALYKKLQARAKREHRSVAQEVTHLLSRRSHSPRTRTPSSISKGLGQEEWRGIDAAAHVKDERDAWD